MPNQDDGKVENLLLSKQLGGSYKASIVSYDLNEQEKQDLKDGVLASGLTDKTTIRPVESESNGGFIRVDANGNCYFIDQVWYENGVLYWTEVQRPCPEHLQEDDVTGGGSSSGNSGDNTDTSGAEQGNDTDNGNPPDNSEGPNDSENPYDGNVGGGTANDNNSDNTDHDNVGNSPDDSTDEIDDCLETDDNGNCVGDITIPVVRKSRNCIELENDTSNQDVKDNFAILKSNVNGENEKGFSIYHTADRNPYVIDNPITEGGPNYWSPGQLVYERKATVHDHNKDKHIEVFSPNDILQLIEMLSVLLEYPDNTLVTQEELSLYLVTEQGYYAIKFSDPSKTWNNFGKYYIPNSPDYSDEFKKEVDKFYKEKKLKKEKLKTTKLLGF